MKINKDFTIQKVGSSYVAVAVGETSRTFQGMIRLNETGAFLWQHLSAGECSEGELVDAILEAYEVDRETAENDVRRVVEVLKKHRIILQ